MTNNEVLRKITTKKLGYENFLQDEARGKKQDDGLLPCKASRFLTNNEVLRKIYKPKRRFIMKRIFILALILILTLTSCATVVKTKEVMEDVKAPVTEEIKKSEEAPQIPTVPQDTAIPVTPETTIDPEEVESPDETPEDSQAPVESAKPEGEDTIILDENETPAIEVNFEDITEEDLEDIFNAITGGETIEFPVIPIE